MPIIRKIIQIGSSKAVSLPKSWLEYHEIKTGCKIAKVAVQVNDVLRITPILSKQETQPSNSREILVQEPKS